MSDSFSHLKKTELIQLASELQKQNSNYKKRIKKLNSYKKLSEQLNEKSNELESITKIGHWKIKLPEFMFELSHEIYNIFEIERSGAELSFENFLEFIHPTDRDDVNKTLQNALHKRAKIQKAYRIITPKRKIKLLFLTGKVYFKDGIPYEIMGTTQDITNIKNVNTDKWESEEKFISILNNSANAITLSKLSDGEILEANDAFGKLVGYSRKFLIGKRTTDLGLWKNLRDRKKLINGVKRDGIAQNFEMIIKTKSGKEKWVLMSAELISINGIKKYLLTTAFDISEKKKMEESLKQSEDRFKVVSDLMSDYAYEYSFDERGIANLEWVTGGLNKITGFSPQEIKKLGGWKSIIHEDDLAIPLEQLNTLMRGKSADAEYRIKDKSGKVHWVKDNAKPIKEKATGKVIGILGALQDTTKQKLTEAKVLRLNRILRTISEINQLIVKETNKDKVLSETCRILVEMGKFPMVWIGMADYSNSKVKPVAQFGFPKNYLRKLDIRFDNSKQGKGIAGTAIRTGKNIICKNIETDKRFSIWWSEAEDLGYRASAALPLKIDKNVIGVLNVHLLDGNVLTKDMIDLLDELAGDISLALRLIGESNARIKAEESLKLANLVVESSPAVLFRWKAEAGWPVEYVSQNIKQFGYTPEELMTGKTSYTSVVHSDDLARVADEVKKHSESGVKKFRQEYRIVTKAGKTIWTDDRTTIERDRKGKIKFYQGVILDITEKKLAELALAESERRYKHFVNQTSDGFYKLTTKVPVSLHADIDEQISLCFQNFYVEECNDIWAKMYGYRSCAEMMGITLKKLYGSWDKTSNNESLKEFLTSGYRIVNSETIEFDRKNNKRYFINNYVGIIDDGFLVEIWGTQQDITDKKHSEIALRESEERLRLALSSANQGLYDLNIQTGDAIVSDEYAAMLGYNPRTFKETNAKWLKRVHPDDAEITRQQYLAYTNGDIPQYHVEFRQRTKSGDWKWILSSGKVVEWDDKGKPVRMLGTQTDITDRKISEEELIQSEEKFRQLAENIRDAFWLFDYVNQKVLYVSPAFETIWGRPAESVLKDYSVWNDTIYPDDLEYASQSMLRMINNGGGEVREYRIVRPDGEIRWINDRGWAIYDDAGKVIRITGVAEDITEQKHAREALELSEKRYRHFVDQTSEGFYRLAAKEPIKIDASENIKMNRSFGSFYVAECNDVMAAMYGFKSSAEIKGLYLYELQSSWDEEISIKSFQQFIKSDLKVINNETVEYDKFGEQKYFLNNYVGIINNGMLVEIWGTQQDITSQKYAEDALIESEKRFRSLFEHSAIGVAQIYTDTGKFYKVNKKYGAILGYTVDELLSLTFQKITHPDDIEKDLANMKKLTKGKISEFSMEKRYFHKNGSIVWVNLTVSPLWEPNEQKEFHMAVVEDITDKKKAEIALRESAEQYKILFDGNPNPMFVIETTSMSFLDVNDAAVKQYGYSLEEFLNMSIKEIRPEEDVPKLIKMIEELDEKFNQVKGFRHKKKNGEIIYVDITSSSIDYKNKKAQVAVIYDITDRVIAEQALRESEEKFRSVFTDSHDCIYVTSADGKLLNMNDAGLELFKLRKNEVTDQNVLDLYSNPEERNNFVEQINREGFVKDFPIRLKNKFNTKLDCLITASVKKDSSGNIMSYQGIIRDITEQKKSERDLVIAKEQAERADRLKTEFLAQMSHEIRTPINTLLSFSSLIREEANDIITDDLKQYFNYQVSAGNRIIRTIDLVLNMSEVQTGSFQLNMKEMNLVNLIHEIYSDYKNIAEENGLVINLLSPVSYLKILGDEYSVHQIFSNLIDNSIKYTPDGSITLTVKKVTTKAVIEVIDTGIGMTKEYMNKLFQPFTQEEQGYTRRFEGSGLGLSLVKKYCDFNNAEISVESEKNMGTKFTVSFNLIE